VLRPPQPSLLRKREILRDVNGRIHDLAVEVGERESQDAWEFICECGLPDCRESVVLEVVEYAERRDRGEPILAPDHQVSRPELTRRAARELRLENEALRAQAQQQVQRAVRNRQAAAAQAEPSARAAWIAVEQLLGIVEASWRECANLQRALVTRLEIEQAKGLLAERLRISLEEAFEVLRTAARNNRRGIHGVAREVIEQPETPREVLAALHARLVPHARRSRNSSS
jgi:ANTAR domain-containing protein